MARGKIRHMFPGGNTAKGFFSYYDYILPQEEAKRIYILKGGPGVGKSTFMKKTGKDLIKEGYDVEFMHCSSDPESLDGIVAPKLKIAIIDGTAPHIVDSKNPGAVDEIIHLGDYWNVEEIEKNKDKILLENSEVGKLFKRAYRYLKASESVYEDNVNIYSNALDKLNLNKYSKKIIEEVFKDKYTKKQGRLRKMFASAITPLGLRNFLTTLTGSIKNIYLIKSQPCAGTEIILERIKNTALQRGYYAEAYYCALLPEKLEHIIIPKLNTAFSTSCKYHRIITDTAEVIDFEKFIDQSFIKKNKDIIDYNTLEFEGLLNRAVFTIEEAKKIHDHLEKYYIPNMDFDAVEKKRKEILLRIMKYKS